MPDSAGRVLSASDGNGTQYVTNATYYASGAEYQRFMPGIYFRTDLNPRLQVSGYYSDNGQTASFFMNKSYNYGALHQDNGNVMSIVNNKDSSRTQTFTYDALNRITSGWSAAGTGTLSWGENYTIDAWGNLMMSPMGGKAQGGNFQHASDVENHAAGLGYDAAGNLTNYTAPGQYVYDAEDRIQSTGGMTYAYDADGNRVEKTSGSTGTLYWYGAPGIMAESDLAGNLKSEYVFFNGKRTARIDSPGNTIHYYLSDHLNSTSLVVSSAGAIEEESDYSPFGTEYVVTGTGTNHYKFTGKERDSESGLDYFGARYYSNGLGRFITPDWAAKAVAVPYAHFDDPQTLNLYGYVRSTPTTIPDEDGHNWQEVRDDLKKAFAGTTVKVSVGVGVGGKAQSGALKGRAELAIKGNISFSGKGKLSGSVSVEGGATAGLGKTQVGLGGSAEQVLGSVDLNNGQRSGPEAPTGEKVIGVSTESTSANGTEDGFSIGYEEGEGALGGGEISFTKEALDALKQAVTDTKNTLFGSGATKDDSHPPSGSANDNPKTKAEK